MKHAWLFALLGWAAAFPGGVAKADGPEDSWSALGPFLFRRIEADGSRTEGFRPFYVRKSDAAGETIEITSLYPFFYYRRYEVVYEWSVFKLINRVGRVADASPAEKAETPYSETDFNVWPFYFSRHDPNQGFSYKGFFPIYGDVRNFLQFREFSWTLFPIYAKGEKSDSTTTYVLFPFFRFSGGGEQGWAFWPLYGHAERKDGTDKNFYLWPLAWDNTFAPRPDDPPGTPPTREFGVLPFYTEKTTPHSVDESYFWPFCGYEDRTEPAPYHETRYFWPFIVQGQGKDLLVDRWGPFYSHSIIKGVDTTWVLWPFWRRRYWDEGENVMTKTQFLYFVAWSQVQTSPAHPHAQPPYKRHFWPIVSAWDNGAGRKQFQILSPFEPLFADNPEMREAWTPFFALVRHSEEPGGGSQTSLLWNAVAWGRSDNRLSHFSLGPFVSFRRHPDGNGWNTSWFDFRAGK